MSKERTAIGIWLYIPLLIIPVLSYGLLNLPNYAVAVMGANGYLGPLLAALIILPGLVAIYLLARRFPGQTIIEQGKSILGWLGTITGIVYLVVNISILTMFTRDICNLVHAYFLVKTPLYIIVLVYLFSAAYVASRGIETIARINSFVMLPALAVLIFLVAISYQNISWTRVLPILSPHISNYFKGGMASVYSYYLLGVSALTLPFLKPLKAFPRIAGGSLAFLAVFYVFFSLCTIGIYGHKYLLRFGWPALEMVHPTNFPYLLLEQAGLLMLIDWIAMILIGTGYYYYSISLGSSQVSRTFDYKKWVWILLPIKFFMISAPHNVTETKVVVEFVAKFGWIVIFAYPIILWLIAVVQRKRGPANAS
ncbi:MAG TPA: GerAB/ArcD/ProY family transporter [Bacillota bacterium]|nr:GerAB/ArcD/ProY family transporter [Bacillota bacterium]